MPPCDEGYVADWPVPPGEKGAQVLPQVRARDHSRRFAESTAEFLGVEDRLAAIEDDSASMRTAQARLVARLDAMERRLEGHMQLAERRSASDLLGVGSVSVEETQQSKLGCIDAHHRNDVRIGEVAPVELGELGTTSKGSESVMPAVSVRNVVPEGVPLDCKWSDSLWDAVLFIGAPWMSRSDSVLLTLLLVACGIVQVVFLGITRVVFNERQITEQKLGRLEQWRLNIGHNIKNYDGLSMTSLTQRVCRPDLYEAEMSSGTSRLVSEMYNYVGTHQLFNGPSLVKVALLIWGLVAIREVMHVWDLSRAVRALPRVSRSSFVEVVGATGDDLRISSITHGRYLWIFLIILWRLGTTMALWWLGNIFLCYYSIAPSEILLNALSLEIVLNIDDTMYILVPSRVKQVLNRIEPLRAPNQRFQFSKIDLRPYFFFVVMAVLIVVTHFTVLSENAAAISNANDTLCSGKQDFIYSMDPFLFVYTSDTNPMNVSKAQMQAFAFSKAVRETIYPDTIPRLTRSDPRDPSKEFVISDDMTFSFAVNGIEETTLRSTWSVEQASLGIQGLANEQCSDILSLMPIIRRFFIESMDGLPEYSGIDEVKTCGDLAQFCSFGPIMRAVCPETCGCTSPVSPLLLSTPSHGCPAACSKQQSYIAELAQLECVEKSPAELSTDPLWEAWGVQLSLSVSDIFRLYPHMRPCDTTCVEDFKAMGCAIIPHWKSRMMAFGLYCDPCSGDFLGDWLLAKALAVYCPITCGCSPGNRTAQELMSLGCPGQCAAGGLIEP